MVRINLVTGHKGNTGKSAWSTAILEYYRAHKHPLIGIDADPDNQTLRKCYPDMLLLALSDDPELASQPDLIFELAYTEKQKGKKGADILVDLPAAAEGHVNRWLKECGLVSIAKESGITFCKWWVCDADAQSIELFQLSVKENEGMDHVFLKNMGRSRSHHWHSFDSDDEIQKLIADRKIPVVEIPAVDSSVLGRVRGAGLQLREVVEDKKLEKVDLSTHMRIRGWLERCNNVLAGVLTIDTAAITARKKAEAKVES
ncbi:MAG: hypothetical protein AAF716_03820 [Cyanobacteria bacterium P01_D01_bin.1]